MDKFLFSYSLRPKSSGDRPLYALLLYVLKPEIEGPEPELPSDNRIGAATTNLKVVGYSRDFSHPSGPPWSPR
jgi:hypothetical protein